MRNLKRSGTSCSTLKGGMSCSAYQMYSKDRFAWLDTDQANKKNNYIWANYNDVSRRERSPLIRWFLFGNFPKIPEKIRFRNYTNLPRLYIYIPIKTSTNTSCNGVLYGYVYVRVTPNWNIGAWITNEALYIYILYLIDREMLCCYILSLQE